MGLGESLMKIVVKVSDVVELAKRFRAEPLAAMQEVAAQVRAVVADTLERVMDAEIDLVLGEHNDPKNKRNGHTRRTFAIKGIGEVAVKVPRDRKGVYESKVVPPSRHYDEAIEKDIALLNLAGLSTRTLALVSRRVLGVKVSAQEVSNSLKAIVPAAKKFLERPLGDRRWVFLYVDGTYFSVRRTTVAKEPTLVVLGIDDEGHKSVLSMVQGDKDNRSTWKVVFDELKARGLDASAVRFGVMDGLPGLAAQFRESFPNALVGRCWVHKATNVFARVQSATRRPSRRRGTPCSTRPTGLLRARPTRRSRSSGARAATRRWRRWSATSRSFWRTTRCRVSTGTRCVRRTRSNGSTRSSSAARSRWTTRASTRSA